MIIFDSILHSNSTDDVRSDINLIEQVSIAFRKADGVSQATTHALIVCQLLQVLLSIIHIIKNGNPNNIIHQYREDPGENTSSIEPNILYHKHQQFQFSATNPPIDIDSSCRSVTGHQKTVAPLHGDVPEMFGHIRHDSYPDSSVSSAGDSSSSYSFLTSVSNPLKRPISSLENAEISPMLDEMLGDVSVGDKSDFALPGMDDSEFTWEFES
jgi:hypothetical protein